MNAVLVAVHRSHLHGTAFSMSRCMRQGAMIFRSGARALMPSSKRTWSLPLPVAPWQMATAPLFAGDSPPASWRSADGPVEVPEQVFVCVDRRLACTQGSDVLVSELVDEILRCSSLEAPVESFARSSSASGLFALAARRYSSIPHRSHNAPSATG